MRCSTFFYVEIKLSRCSVLTFDCFATRLTTSCHATVGGKSKSTRKAFRFFVRHVT